MAVLEKGYLGGANTARNTTIIRANYLTPEGLAVYGETVKLWRERERALNINLMYNKRGHLTLAHTDSAVRTAHWRADVGQTLAYRILGDSASAEYMWDFLLNAKTEYGGTAVGLGDVQSD